MSRIIQTAAAVLFGLLMGAGVAALAGRNPSGTYSLYTPGNPVTTHSVISSSWANNTLTDIAQGLTMSLDRNGQGGMLAPLRGVDGTLGSPALSFTSAAGDGLFDHAPAPGAAAVGGRVRRSANIRGFGNPGCLQTQSFDRRSFTIV